MRITATFISYFLADAACGSKVFLRYFLTVLREAPRRRAIWLMLSFSIRCQRRILPIVSTHNTPGHSARKRAEAWQPGQFYVIRPPFRCLEWLDAILLKNCSETLVLPERHKTEPKR